MDLMKLDVVQLASSDTPIERNEEDVCYFFDDLTLITRLISTKFILRRRFEPQRYIFDKNGEYTITSGGHRGQCVWPD